MVEIKGRKIDTGSLSDDERAALLRELQNKQEGAVRREVKDSERLPMPAEPLRTNAESVVEPDANLLRRQHVDAGFDGEKEEETRKLVDETPLLKALRERFLYNEKTKSSDEADRLTKELGIE